MTRGKFITFEGGEGAGKSTQIRALESRLAASGHAVIVTREPGGTAFAEAVRAFILHGGGRTHPGTALAETMMFFAARADHVERVIRPALADGKFVLCDRFTDSTRAYQGAASGVADADIVALDRLVVGDAKPALTIILDLDPTVGLARAEARRRQQTTSATDDQRDLFEARALAFHTRLRQGFLDIARREAERCAIIDANVAPDAVAAAIAAVVSDRLGVR